MVHQRNIQVISAGSVLGLQSSGVERLPASLLSNGLLKKIHSENDVIEVPLLNEHRNKTRDPQTHILNVKKLLEFSLSLHPYILDTLSEGKFPLVLGGDCSILIGILSALKSKGDYGLLFLDAHADFYQPEKSTTGEAADMELAIVTGRGPDLLTNVNDLKPYVQYDNVIHIGQRDWEETKKHESQDIRDTTIQCYDLQMIEEDGLPKIIPAIELQINTLPVEGFWIHFDTDVLSDDINPAVDYRLPGGLSFFQVESFLKSFLLTGKIAGISVTIYNPGLDKKGTVAQNITNSLARCFAGK